MVKNFIDGFYFDDMLNGSVSRQNAANIEHSRSSGILKRMNSIDSPIKDPIQSSSMLDDAARSPKFSFQQKPQSKSSTFLFQEKLVQLIKQNKIVSLFYVENPNYKKEQKFVDSFLVINALKGLSNLAMYSLDEDEYGIVQQTLPEIINTLVLLQKVIIFKFLVINFQ